MNTQELTSSTATPVVSTQGCHVVADLYGCNPTLLNNEAFLSDLLVRAAEQAHATVLNTISHAFTPQGVTILVLLAESHLSIHTWPEKSYAAVDVMTCGDTMEPQAAVDMIVAELTVQNAKTTIISRGSHDT